MRRIEVKELAGGARMPITTSKRAVLQNGWESELRERADAANVRLADAEGALFRLEKIETGQYYRLLFRIDNLEAGEDSISISFQGRTQSPDLLEWAAVLNEAPDGGRQFVLREQRRASSSALNVVGTIDGRLPSGYKGPYFVAFHFSAEAGDFVLDRLLIEVGRAGASTVPDARAPRGSDSHALFDIAWYLAQLQSPLSHSTSPLTHYLQFGEARGLSPHPLFDPKWYVSQLPEGLANGDTALQHYLRVGAARGFTPHPLFDSKWYSEQRARSARPSGS